MQAAVIGRRLVHVVVCGRPTVAVQRPVSKAKVKRPQKRSNNIKRQEITSSFHMIIEFPVSFPVKGCTAILLQVLHP